MRGNKKRQTILIDYPNNGTGGLQNVLRYQSNELVKSGYKVVRTYNHVLEREYEQFGSVEQVLIPITGNEYTQSFWQQMIDVIMRKNVDVFWNHNIYERLDIVQKLIMAHMLGLKSIMTTHSFSLRFLLGNNRNLYNLAKSLKFYDTVVVLDESSQLFWHALGANTYYLPNPIPFKPVLRSRQYPRGTFRLFWCGHLYTEVKQPLELLNICYYLKKMNMEFTLTMVGNPVAFEPDISEVITNNIKVLGLESHVTLEPTTHDIAKYYENSDCYVNTSSIEGFPTVLSEATAYAIPVVMYDLPYLSLVRSNRGIITVPFKDAEGAAVEIAKLIKDSELYEMTSALALSDIKEFEKRFNQKRHLRKVIENVDKVHHNQPEVTEDEMDIFSELVKLQNMVWQKTIPRANSGQSFPSVTVVIVHNSANRGKLLSKAVQSVKQQTYRGVIEIVLVYNGGNGVHYAGLCEKYVNDPHIRLYRSTDEHVGAARNKGASLVHTDWFTFLDDDDWLTKGYIADLVDGISNDVNLVIGKRCRYQSGRVSSTDLLNKAIANQDTKGKDSLCTNEFLFSNMVGRLYRTTYYKSRFIPAVEDMTVAEDVIFWAENIVNIENSFALCAKDSEEYYVRRATPVSLTRGKDIEKIINNALNVIARLTKIIENADDLIQGELALKLLFHQIEVLSDDYQKTEQLLALESRIHDKTLHRIIQDKLYYRAGVLPDGSKKIDVLVRLLMQTSDKLRREQVLAFLVRQMEIIPDGTTEIDIQSIWVKTIHLKAFRQLVRDYKDSKTRIRKSGSLIVDASMYLLTQTNDMGLSKRIVRVLFRHMDCSADVFWKIKVLLDLLKHIRNATQRRLIRDQLSQLSAPAADALITLTMSSNNPTIAVAARLINDTSTPLKLFSEKELVVHETLDLFWPVRFWYKNVKIDPALKKRPIKFDVDASGEQLHLFALDGPYTLTPYYREFANVKGIKQLRFEINTKSDASGLLIMYYYGYDKDDNRIQTQIRLRTITKGNNSRSVFKVALTKGVVYANFICGYCFETAAHATVEDIILTKYKKA
jgi:glycosyltransferase involved in cell wall biosynthesis